MASAAIGNALEWFDVIVYGFFALAIAKNFFPAADPNVSVLIALGTFGVAFFMRPIGGLVLGVYADRVGRKAALMLTITLMMTGTLLIAITPAYSSIGIAAPLVMITARLIQGFSAGGEFATATAFLAEQSHQRRGFYSSWQFATQGLSMVLASCFGVALTSLLTPPQIVSWGWRVPFFFGLLIGPIALFMRKHIGETEEFIDATRDRNPIADSFRHQKASMCMGLGMVVLVTVATYMILYMPVYAVTQLKLSEADGFRASLTAGAIIFTFTPLSGLLTDRIGRLRVAITMATALIIFPIPVFVWLIRIRTPGALIASQVVLGLLTAGYFGAIPAILTELFPVRSRSTGMALSYNLSVMTFGGFAPFAIAWLITATGIIAAPGFYLALAALVSLIALLAVRFLGRWHL